MGTKDEEMRQAGGGGWIKEEKGRQVCAYFSVLVVFILGSREDYRAFPFICCRKTVKYTADTCMLTPTTVAHYTGDNLLMSQSNRGLWQSQ